MWKFWHYLFGWEYICYKWEMNYAFILRVRTDLNGRKYVHFHRDIMFLDQMKSNQIHYLTRKPT